MHARFSPQAHRFLYRIFLFAIDLDELDLLHRKLGLFSVGRRNLYSFREQDYLPSGEPIHPRPVSGEAPVTGSARGLKDRVVGFLATHGVDLEGGRVVLVTLPRVLGYLFNPVSFYFCYGKDGTPVAAITEVTNTFKEMKPYVLGPQTQANPGTFELRTPKFFYVSPYSDVDVAFDFVLRPLGDKLSVQIDDYAGPQRMLTSTLNGPRRALTGLRLAWFTLKYPLITLKIISLIHWQALRLWFKNVPWYAKGARSREQHGLYRPHRSLAPVPRTEPQPGPAAPAEVENF